jgi:hypothetical protein
MDDDRPISEAIAEIMADVPSDVLARLPKDGASQHDHYLRLAQERRLNWVFADTFYWIALTHSDDASHAAAVAFDTSRDRPPILTTEDETFSAGLDLYAMRLDKAYSMTDCDFDGDDAPERADGRAHQRPALRAGRVPGVVSILIGRGRGLVCSKPCHICRHPRECVKNSGSLTIRSMGGC